MRTVYALDRVMDMAKFLGYDVDRVLHDYRALQGKLLERESPKDGDALNELVRQTIEQLEGTYERLMLGERR